MSLERYNAMWDLIRECDSIEEVDQRIDEVSPGGKGGVGIANAKRALKLKQFARAIVAEAESAYEHPSFYPASGLC